MAGIKSLAKDTALYGISSIIGKTLNWFLTPLFTYNLATTGEYGIITNLYAYVALVIVILTFGMETGLFRFINKKDEYNPTTVYSTTLIAVGSVVFLFLLISTLFLDPIARFTAPDIPSSYIYMMILVLSMDAFSSIPFAYLRYKQRPLKFAALKILFIILYIAFCCFFLLLCPELYENRPGLVDWFYEPGSGVKYILLSNLLATFIQTCCLLPEITGFKYKLDTALLKKMLRYSFPLLILGIAGILNQTADKILFPLVYPDKEDAMNQLGIYGACFKIAVVMVMFTQAFRYAYEPFIFAKNKGEDNKKSYADAMKYFILLGLFIFLGITCYMDILKYFIKPTYFEGLPVVPIVMAGELFFGIYFNLSLWYKLTDQTKWGAIFSGIGCFITLAINIAFIPVYGYMACAWATFISNLIMMFLSYFMGQKRFPIAYDLKTIGIYFGLTVVLYGLAEGISIDNLYLRLAFRTFLLCIYGFVLIKRDLPLQKIPFLNRFIKARKGQSAKD